MTLIRAIQRAAEFIEEEAKYTSLTEDRAKELAEVLTQLTGNEWTTGERDPGDFYFYEA